MNLEIKKVPKTELTNLVGLVSSVFHYPVGETIDRDFPLLFSEENCLHLCIGVDDNNKILSHAGSLFTHIYVADLKLPVGGIGGVFTLPEYRGQGFAHRITEAACNDLMEQGAALAFLWSGEHDFYRQLGFELVGAQWSIQVPVSGKEKILELVQKKSKQNISAWKVVEGAQHVLSDGLALLSRYPLGVQRTPEQFSRLIQCPGAQVFALKDGEALRAYMVVGKGIDLKDHVHEWAGDEPSLLYLLTKVLEVFKRDLTILSPQFTPEEAPWIYTLETLGCPSQLGYMAMIKILNFPILQKFVTQYVEKILSTSAKFHFTFDEKTKRYQLGWGTEVQANINELEILKLLFGPELPSKQMHFGNTANQVFDGVFPIRLWWWGLDSV